MSNDETKVRPNDKLRMTQQLIADEYKNMSTATHSVLNTSGNINKTKEKYNQYSDKIKRSKDLVDEIQRAEKWDEQKLRFSFNFFVFTVVYLFLKRFFLWEFLYATYYLISIFVTYALDFIIMPLISVYTSDDTQIKDHNQNSNNRAFVLMDYLLIPTSATASEAEFDLRFF